MATSAPTRREFLKGAAAGGALLGLHSLGLAADAGTPAERPNVVVILCDDFGYECVAADGGAPYRTPNLDRLAAGGVRFERCYAQPLCTPTRAQLMTGQYNVRNYVRFGYLDPKQQTFAQWFRDAGYATGIYGKWQLANGFDGPAHFGFDDYCLWQLTRRPARYVNPGLEINGREVDYTQGEYGPDIASDHLCAFLEKNRDRPFLAYYPMILTHAPYEPTPDSPDYRKDVTGDEAQRKNAGARYFADNVAYADKLVGQVIAKLDALKLREKTLVLFVGDNGTGGGVTSQLNGRPFAGGKGKTTDSGTHVPFIANWPGKVAAGRVCSDLTDTTDFAPTLLDAAGLARPKAWQFDGQSLWPQLQGQRGKPREALYAWYARDGGETGREWATGPSLKLYAGGRLFDLAADPEEQKPLSEEGLSAARRAERDTLRATLDRFQGARPEWTWKDQVPKAGGAGKKAGGKKKNAGVRKKAGGAEDE